MSSWLSDFAKGSKVFKGFAAAGKACADAIKTLGTDGLIGGTKTIFGNVKNGLSTLWNGNGKMISVPEIISDQKATTLLQAYIGSNATNYSQFANSRVAAGYTQDELNALKEYSSQHFMTTQGLSQTSVRLNAEAARQASSITSTGIKGALGSVAGSVGSMFLNMFVSAGAMLAMQKGIEFLYNLSHKKENIIKAGTEADSKIKNIKSSYQEKADFNDEKIDRFTQLQQGVNASNNKNLHLTNDEYSEYISLCNEIASIYPSVVSSWDSQGNAIVNLGNSAGQTKEKLNDLLESAKDVADFQVREQLDDSAQGAAAQMITLQEKAQREDEEIANAKSILASQYSSSSIRDKLTKQIYEAQKDGSDRIRIRLDQSDADEESIQSLMEIFDEHGYNAQSLHLFDESNSQDIDLFGLPSSQEINDMLDEWMQRIDYDKVKDAQIALTEAQGNKNSYDSQIKEQVGKIAQDASDALETNQNFKELPETAQQVLRNSMANVDWQDVVVNNGGMDFFVTDYVDDNIIGPIVKAMNNADLKTVMNRLEGINDRQSTMTADEYSKQIGEQAEKIKEIFDSSDLLSDADYENFVITLGLKIKDENGNLVDPVQGLKEEIADLLPKDSKYLDQVNNEATYEQLVTIKSTIDQDNSVTPEDAVKSVLSEGYKAKEESITFTDFLGSSSDESSVNTSIDTFQEKISALQTALDGLKSGDYSESDITDLIQQFPQLGTALDSSTESVEGLKTALGGLQVTALSEFVEKYRELMTSITDPTQLQAAQTYLDNIINSVDLSSADLSNLRQTLFDMLWSGQSIEAGDTQNFVAGLLSHIDTNDKVAQEALYKTVLSAGSKIFTWSSDQIDAAVNSATSDINYRNAGTEIARLQNHRDIYANKKSKLEIIQAMKQANGEILTADDYDELISISKEDAYDAERQRTQALIQMNNAAKNYGVDSQQYLDAAAAVREYDLALLQAQQDQQGWENSKQLLPLEELEREYTQAENLSSDFENRMASKQAKGIKLTATDYLGYIGHNTGLKNIQEKILKEAEVERADKIAGGATDTSELDSKIANAKSTIAQLEQETIQFQQSLVNLPADGLNQDLAKLENDATAIQNSIALKEAQGKRVNASDYEKLIDNGQSQIDNLRASNVLLVGQEAYLKSIGADYSEIDNQIAQNNSSISSLEQSMEGWKDSIKQLPLDELGREMTSLQENATAIQDKMNLDSARGVKSTVKDYQDLITNSNLQIRNLQTQNNLLQSQLADTEPLSSKYSEITSQIASNVSAIDQARQSQIEWNEAARELQYQPEEGLAAYNKAKETRNAGDNYLDMMAAFKEAQEAYKNGLIGTDEFKAAAKMLSPNGMDDAANWEENYGKAQRYFTEDRSGLLNFLNDLKGKTNEAGEALASVDEATGQWSYNIDDVQGSADALGISFESFLAIMGRLQDYGYSNNFFSSVEEGEQKLGDLYYDLTEAEGKLKQLEQDKKDGDETVTSTVLAAQEQKVNAIKQSIMDTETLLDQLIAKSDEELNADFAAKMQTYGAQINKALGVDDKDQQQAYLKTIYSKMSEELGQEQLDSIFYIDDNGSFHIIEEGLQNIIDEYGTLEDMDTTHTQEAIGELTKKINDNKEAFQSDLDVLKDYSLEELSSITFGDGQAESDPRLAAAESAIDEIIQGLGLSQDEASLLIQTLAKMGLIKADIEPELDKDSVDEAMEEGQEEVDKNGVLVSEVDLQVRDEATSDLQRASDLLSAINGETAYADVNVSSVEDAQAELDGILNKLTKHQEVLISLGFEPSTKGAPITAEDIKSQIGDVDVPMHYSSDGNQEEPKDEEAKVFYKWADQTPPINETARVFYLWGSQAEPIDKTAYVHYIAVGKPDNASTVATGTAHASGTAYDMWTDFRHSTGAYANGSAKDWRLPADETALVNEVGTESIVRDGKWMTLPGGAHMENLQKGDIIFSAAQTKELVETGKVLSGGGHGRVIGSTSYADGSVHAYALFKNEVEKQQRQKTNNWTHDPYPRAPRKYEKSVPSIEQTGQNVMRPVTGWSGKTTPSYTPINTGPSLGGGGNGGGNTGGGGGNGGNSGGGGGNGGKSNNNSGSNEFSDWLSKFFDWAEVRLNRLNRLTEKWSDRAERAVRYSYNAVASDKNIDKQYSAKKAYTQKAIQANANEITGNEKSITSYRSFLDRIVNKSKGKLDGKTLDKIRNDTVNGTFDIQEYADKGVTKGKLEMIQAYQEWYEKILNCQDSIEELRETQKDLAEQLMNLPLDQATAKVEKFQAALDRLSSAYDAVSGGSTAYLKQMVSDSKAAYDAAKKNYTEQKALQGKAQQNFKEQQQNMQKVSGLSKSQKDAVKAGTKINTNGLKGDALKAAQKYNTAWEKKANANSSTAEAREYYKSTIKDYKENQKLYKKYKDKPAYQYQNALLNRQTAEQKKINNANQQALRTTNRNVETSKKERDTTQNQLKNYKESILGNSKLELSNEQRNAIKKGQQAALYGASGATLEALKKYNEYLEASKNATNKYNSSLEANAEAINNAAESQAEYIKMLQENAKQAFDNVIDYFSSKADLVNSRISHKEAQRNYYDAAGISQTGKTYSRSYRSQISNTESAISNKQEELKKAKAAYKANSKNMSEKDRRSALAEIEGLETELLNLKADAADLKSELAQLDILKLTLALDKLSAAADKLEHKLNMIQGHNKLPGESVYTGLINNAGQQISNYEQQNAKLRKQQGGYQKGSKKWQELQDQIVSNESAIDGLLEKQLEWRKSLVNIPVELAARKTEKLSKNLEILQKRLENASKASVAYQAGIIRAEQRNAQQTYETAKALPGQIKRKQNQNASKGLAAYKSTIGKGTYSTNKDGTLKANRKATDADKRKINQYNAWRKAISAGKEVNTDHLDKNSNAYKYFDSYNLAFDEYNTALKDKSMAVQDYISTTTELAEALANLPIDKMNEKLEKVNTAQEILQAQYNNLDGYEAKNKNLNKQNAKAKEERDLYRNTKNYTAARVKNEFKNVAAIAKAQGKTEGQKLSLEGIKVGSDAYIAIKNYNAAIDASKTAADNAAKAEENYTNTIRTNAKARFDNVISDYESQQSVQEAEASRLSTRLQWQESMGIAKDSATTKDIYEQSIANNEGLIFSKREELAKAQAAYNANYQDMSEEDLRAAQAQILALQEDIQKTEITNEDLKDSMRSDIYYTKFEKALEKTEALRKSLEAINSIITDDAMYDKNGLLTDIGYAKLATTYKDYESSLSDIATLQEKIATIKSLKGTNGMSDEEYVKELTEAQGELADKLQETASARENVLTIMKSLAQAELDAVNKVIDARKNALQKKKDYYDYDKQLRNGTKELNLLKQQRAALEGISGLEAERKRKELDQQISDKQESLEDTIQDHLYNIQVEGLEDLKTELQENYEDYVRDLAQNLDKIKDVMNGVGDTVSDAAKNINKTLKNILAQYGVTLSDLGIKGYASGTQSVPHTGLYEVNERGNEMIVTPEGHILMPLTKGTGVINADMTANLMAAAKTGVMPQSYLVDPSIPQINRSITITNHYDSLLTVNGDVSKDTLPELQTILKESYKYTTQQLSKEFSLLGHR